MPIIVSERRREGVVRVEVGRGGGGSGGENLTIARAKYTRGSECDSQKTSFPVGFQHRSLSQLLCVGVSVQVFLAIRESLIASFDVLAIKHNTMILRLVVILQDYEGKLTWHCWCRRVSLLSISRKPR